MVSVQKKDVVIVGAGVSGLFLSALLEKIGIDYVTLEKRSRPGKYGNRVINLSAFAKLGGDSGLILTDIKEINFVSPRGHVLSVSSPQPRGYVTNLQLVEEKLLSSISNRSNLLFREPVVDLDMTRGVVRTARHEIEARVVVLAGGLISQPLSTCPDAIRPRVIFCQMYEIHGQDVVTTVMSNTLAPGFYGWIMPLRDRIEVGIGRDGGAVHRSHDLDTALFSMPLIREYAGAQRVRKLRGSIPTSVVDRHSGANWALIGDASGGEPLMGASIHKCIDEAALACDVIQRVLTRDEPDMNVYEAIWQQQLGVEMKRQAQLRRMLDASPDDRLDEAFRMAGAEPISGSGLINELFKKILQCIQCLGDQSGGQQ